jgi:apolipoprotein D and lipocalin family protein
MIPAGRAWRRMFALAIGTASLASMIVAGTAYGAEEPAPPSTVASVDLSRYVGKWYEIARIPNRFQTDCVGNVMATYKIREDGRIDVLNECEQKDGTIKKAEGIAKVVDPSTNAKLKVSFVSFFGYRPFWGDYWILGLGPDYEYAVVGSPDRKYGWILARDPHPDLRIVEEARSVLRERGFDPDRFEQSRQD